MRSKPKRYKGNLGEYRAARIPMGGLLTTDEERRRQIGQWIDEDLRNLDLLADHFGIPQGEGRIVRLAIVLAQELNVPAFTEKPRTGAYKKWNAITGGILVVEMERLIEPNNQAHGETWAAKVLAKRRPWSEFLGDSKGAAESLRHQYQKYKGEPQSNLLRDAFKMYEYRNELAEWDAQIVQGNIVKIR